MFTDQLGTADSKLGQLVLGKGTQYVGFGYQKYPSSVLHLVQQVKVNVTYNRSPSNTLNITHAAYHVSDGIASNTLNLTHQVQVTKYKLGVATNTLSLTQQVTPILTYGRKVFQGLLFTQQAKCNIYRGVQAANTLNLTQLAEGKSSRKATNTLILSQSATVVKGKSIRHSLEFTQTADRSVTFGRQVNSVLTVYQTLARNLTVRRTVPHTLALSHTAVGVAVKAAKNMLVLAQVAVGITAKPTSSYLPLTHLATVSKSVKKVVNQTLILTQSVTVKKSRSFQASSVLAFTQSAKATKRITATASNTLVLSHDVTKTRTIKTVPHVLNLTHAVTVSKRASPRAQSTLALSHTVQLSKTLVRNVQHTIVFRDSFQRYIGIGAGSGTGSGQYVTVPAVQVVKVKKIVVLQTDSLVLTLPAPEFNDSEAGTGRINIKRSMAGGRRVYKRDNLTSKLNYTFVIDRRKAIELRNFILLSNSKVIRMENWKGEIWYVQMVNTPFSFGEDAAWFDTNGGGNKASITLQFEGMRTN